MRGIVCAGGFGTRLRPMTLVTNKHLLPVYDRPMVYYPIQTLKEAGITDIMIVTGPDEPGARNLITKLAAYPNIINVPNSISNTDEFITATLKLMEKRRTGIYNVTNPGAVTQKEIIDAYCELVEPGHNYKIISLDELYTFTKAKRSNCVLSSKKLEAEGIRLRPVMQSVRETLAEYAKNLKK